MMCEDFIRAWEEGTFSARTRFLFFFHRLECRRCREEWNFIRGLSRAMEGNGAEPEFLREMREGLLEEGARMGLFSREALEERGKRPFIGFFIPVLGGLALLLFAFVYLLGSFSPKGVDLRDFAYLPGNAALVSQLDDGALASLDTSLERALGGDASVVMDMCPTPWADALDQAWSHPQVLKVLEPPPRGEVALAKTKEV